MSIDHELNSSLLSAALDYAKRGWSVLPLHNPTRTGGCTCGKPDCTSIGKHPRLPNGVKGASADPSLIKHWWKQWPEANIGIATGANSGLAVLDIDVKSGGLDSLAQLEQEHGSLPRSHFIRTGSGGNHFYFQHPVDDIGNRTGVVPGIDFKTEGGFIVAPPSRHACGNKYDWLEKSGQMSPMPEWLTGLLKKKTTKPLVVDLSGENVIPAGIRNQTIYSTTCSLRAKGWSEEAILPAISSLNDAHCRPPLELTELENIVQSACSHDPGPIVSDKSIHLTDVGNAKRLALKHGQDFRYCPTWNNFLTWDGKRFVIDNSAHINRMAKKTVLTLYLEAAKIDAEEDRKRYINHALRSESQNRIKAMIDCVKSEEGVVAMPDTFDQNDWQLNCANGTIDLRTGELMAHDRANLQTKLVPINYDPDATCPLWEAFLSQIMDEQQDLIDFLQKAVGYSLTGSTKEQCLFILHGTGSNGKSVFQNMILALLGEYGQQTPTETLMVKKQSGINNDVARLRGARFVSASEGEQGQRLAESLIKQLTGGDKITARFLHGEFFEFEPKFKIFLATNHKPVIRGTDNGIWRRMRLIPFKVVIPNDKQDKDLPEKLKSEMAGILRWSVAGCLKWQEEGLEPPTSIVAASAEYRSEMDSLQAFIDDRLVLSPDEKVSTARLYGQYQEWCEANGERSITQRILGMRLKEKGFENRRSGANGSSVWHGLSLKMDVSDDSPTELTTEDAFFSAP